MRQTVLVILCVIVATWYVPAQSRPETELNSERVTFAPVHIYLDSGSIPLAAYQFEFKAVAGQVEIVGVEGGEHLAFSEPPHYDPAALAGGRIIIAAFNTTDTLPTGKTRIATLHLQITGDTIPEYEIKQLTAADTDGRRISAEVSFEQGENQ